MKYDCFPFTIINVEEITLPVVLFENSRYKFEFVRIDQKIIDKVFPNQQIIKSGASYQSPVTFNIFRLKKVYQDLLLGNMFLKATRKTKFDRKDASRYSKGIDGIMDLIHLFTKVTLNEFISFDESGNKSGGGSKGKYRQTTCYNSNRKISNEQIEEIQEYAPKYIKIDSKKLRVSFELLRNADINGSNSFALKCSLIVLLIESFFLEGISSRKENFAFCLNDYLETNSENTFREYYVNRGTYFHSGIDSFRAPTWNDLHDIAKKIICDFLDDEAKFKRRVHEIKEKVKKS